ncbi:MAG TPA: universal stress protein [Longimicrobium sp.]|nr:universal stress protein [Longimicrobium sp.]
MDGRILVATDGTGASLGALRVAAALAERGGEPPIVVSVAEPIALEGSVLYGMPGQALALCDRPEEQVRDVVEEQLRALGAPAAGWRPEVQIGAVAPTIARLAEDRGAGIVLLGRGRHSRVERFFGGDTTLNVARLSRVPVLAVEPDAAGLPRRALAAVDFSEYSRDAVRTLLDLLADDAAVRLVHASWPVSGAEGDDWMVTYLAGARARLAELAASLQPRRGAWIETEVLEGPPTAGLLALAERMDADVIAAGSHGYGFFTRMVMGSVSTRLLRQAPCSVLVAPPRAPSAELRQARAARLALPEPAAAGV